MKKVARVVAYNFGQVFGAEADPAGDGDADVGLENIAEEVEVENLAGEEVAAVVDQGAAYD